MNAAPRQTPRRPYRQAARGQEAEDRSATSSADPEQRGLYLRIPPEGPIVFAAVARDPYGKQVWATLGTTADLKDRRGTRAGSRGDPADKGRRGSYRAA